MVPSHHRLTQDFHIIVFFMPVGLVLSFFPMTDASLFLVIYGVTSVHFSGIMVRLMLVLAPACCFLGAIGMSALLTSLGTPPPFRVFRNRRIRNRRMTHTIGYAHKRSTRARIMWC